MLLRCGTITSLRQVRNPTMKNSAVVTAMARVSVFFGDSIAALVFRMVSRADPMVTLSMRFDIDLIAMETNHESRVEAISLRAVTWKTAARTVRTAVFDWIVVVRAMRSSC